MKRRFNCPRCGNQVKIPVLWIIGVEVIFGCAQCGRRFRTGYKKGALLFGIALTLAVCTANLGAWIMGSVTIPFMAAAIIPVWIFYGFLLRRAVLLKRYRVKAHAGRQAANHP